MGQTGWAGCVNRVHVLISDTLQLGTVGSNFGQREKEKVRLSLGVERRDRQNKERERALTRRVAGMGRGTDRSIAGEWRVRTRGISSPCYLRRTCSRPMTASICMNGMVGKRPLRIDGCCSLLYDLDRVGPPRRISIGTAAESQIVICDRQTTPFSVTVLSRSTNRGVKVSNGWHKMLPAPGICSRKSPLGVG